MANKTTIKDWFKTGLKPTQNHFWETWDSFWHKSEMIPVIKIGGLIELLQPINNHFNDANAHSNLIVKSRFIPFGEFQIYKKTNTNPNILNVGDVALGFLADGITFLPFAQYLGGDIQNINNWNTSPIQF